MIEIGIIIACAYLIGSLPSGYWIARARGIDDIRAIGSGNIGATNVARALGIKYFFLVFFCDFFKAYSYLRALSLFGHSELVLIVASAALLIGNAASIFLQFKGGKGVATSFGITLVFYPQLVLVVFSIWLFMLFCIRNVGIASVVSLIALPFIANNMFHVDGYLFLFLLFMSIFGLWLHRDNIKIYMTQLTNRQVV